MSERHHSPLDRLLGQFDEALRTLFAKPSFTRENPAAGKSDDAMDAAARELTGRLMRVNHTGEICAQALYQGQALTARLPDVREKMEQAAREENDHLAWTESRIREVGTHTSYLNPLFYAGSFALGAIAGLAGDKWSLGFLAETERQVVDHLTDHLSRLPTQDERSRAIVERMREEEAHHATSAIQAGAAELPTPVKRLMRLTSKLMTNTTHWV
ncbi:MAG TPA: 2-polyprenyl-3-methyl-6-methoxy-1,4-benzoquinone monooxygenase [Burkholderiales bacterium]|nr:2-polyprenyl-3-methyl-6-methoxy-1,4-benzoquinone monooxygenase [Burkholderiales bacterium]